MPTFSTVLLHLYLSLNVATAFQITSSSSNVIRGWSNNISTIQRNNIDTIQLNSSPNDDNEENELIIGGMSDALQKLGAEGGYLAAAKARNEEAKAKMMEQVRKEEEEAEAYRQAKKESGTADNFGPGDLSDFKGFADDGFENSVGNDDTGGWGEVKEAGAEEEEEEEPKLFLFGDDDNTSDAGGLIL
jgi:hypothetical protein